MKLRLKDLAFDKVSVEVSDNFDRTKFDGGRHRAPLATDFEGADVHFGFSARLLDKEMATFKCDDEHTPVDVDLFVEGKPKSEGQFPYEFAIQVSGLFVIFEAEGTSDEEKLRFAQIKGSRHLLQPIREMLITITSRSYWGSVFIPEVNISQLVQRAFERELKSREERDAPGTLEEPSSSEQ